VMTMVARTGRPAIDHAIQFLDVPS
jgi:hypothetical protein